MPEDVDLLPLAIRARRIDRVIQPLHPLHVGPEAHAAREIELDAADKLLFAD